MSTQDRPRLTVVTEVWHRDSSPRNSQHCSHYHSDSTNLRLAETIEGGRLLSVLPHVERLAKTYATASLSKGRIAEEIILTSSQAKVPVHVEAESHSDDTDPLPTPLRAM